MKFGNSARYGQNYAAFLAANIRISLSNDWPKIAGFFPMNSFGSSDADCLMCTGTKRTKKAIDR